MCEGFSRSVKTNFFFSLLDAFVTHQRLVLNLLPDEFVFTEGIACLSCDGVYGSLFHLLFDGTEQHEERLASTLLLDGNPEIRWIGGRKKKSRTRERNDGKGKDRNSWSTLCLIKPILSQNWRNVPHHRKCTITLVWCA